MRVLICSFTYPPRRDGVATAARALAEGLAQRGHTVTVATEFHSERAAWRAGMSLNVEIEQFKVSEKQGFYRTFRGEVDEFRQFVRSYEGDAIFCLCWQNWATDLAMQEFSGSRARKILCSHGFDAHIVHWQKRFPWGLGSFVQWIPYVLALPWSLRRFDWVVFLREGPNLERFFDRWVAHVTRFQTWSAIPNGAFIEAVEECTADFRSAFGIGSALMFLCVANYEDRKNQILAIRAFRRARIPGAVLVLIGSEFNELSKRWQAIDATMSANSFENRVVFLEGLSRDMTTAAFKACDIFVLSAKAETQPIVILEAMACSKAFISTDTGCVRDYPGGYIANDEDEMADQMTRLAGDPHLRATLGEAGRTAVAQTYSWPRTLDAYDALLNRMAPSLPLRS